MNAAVDTTKVGEKPAIGGVDRSASVKWLLAPFAPFLEDPGITEICVNGPGVVFTESGSAWTKHIAPLVTLESMNSLAVAVAKYANNNFSDQRPIMSAQLPGTERVQFVRAPACEADSFSMTIRKPSIGIKQLESYRNEGFFNHVRPMSNELLPEERELLALRNSGRIYEFLTRSVELGKTMVIAGETGSGKTTLMKALVQLVPHDLRIITIEDVRELFLPKHENRVHLLYPSEAKDDGASIVTSAALLRSCLRMKPSRLFLAELRGGETFDFINVCSSGHGGSITSAHAGSADLTFERLALMVLQNQMGRQLPYEVIRRLLYMVVDVVVHVHNDVHGHGRHITEVWYDPMRRRERDGGNGGLDDAQILAAAARLKTANGDEM